MGQAVVEAMLAEVPIVASAAGGVPEVVEHAVDGLIVPVADAIALAEGIERALLRRREAQLRCAHARQVALSRFSVEQMVTGTLAAYEHFAARSTGSG